MSDTSYLDWPFFEPRHRPLRIYEGASEVQKLIIARETLSSAPSPPAGEGRGEGKSPSPLAGEGGGEGA